MTRARPVVFGEVLFDRFPTGEAVLGGAPFNVARHLAAFGLEPLFLSRVGDDDAGRAVLAAMDTWGMDASGVQVDREYPTGAVEVTLAGGEPGYDILAEQAYDHVRAADLPELTAGSLLCHGTLALRGAESRAALEHLLRTARPRRVLDVNLRAPWWSRAGVSAVLPGVSVLKLNEAELAELAGPSGRLELAGTGDVERAARSLLEASGARRIVVTRGARGALAVDRDEGTLEGAPRGGTELVDTVGAGDSFTAVLILGECLGWTLRTSLARSLELAEAITGVRGATVSGREFYSPFLRHWELA